MKKIVIGLVVSLLWVSVVSAREAVKTMQADQTSVNVTVYNVNRALVKDIRRITLPKGEGEVRFMDVAASIHPETVHVKSLAVEDGLNILEQNYEYDLISRDKLLDKYVGKRIKLFDLNEYQDKQDVVEAELLSNNNDPVYKIGGEIYLGYPGYHVLPEMPEGLISQPTLSWLYANTVDGPQDVEVAYLTDNIMWKADYVLVLDQDDSRADLSGWVTVNNQSGATYKDAKLKLVAGDMNVVQDRSQYDMMEGMASASQRSAAPQFEEESFFEYHLYDLQRLTTIKDNQTKQISLLEANGFSVSKEFVVAGAQPWWFSRHFQQDNYKQPVQVKVTFKNGESNHLGMPLPAGIVRLYKRDKGGSLQFIGEDKIDHTPKDEEVSLKVGDAFDVVAERRQVAFRQVSQKVSESDWEVVIRNHKAEDITVGVIDPVEFYANWMVTVTSYPYEKLDAGTLRFDVPVAKDGEAKLTYTVRVWYK